MPKDKTCAKLSRCATMSNPLICKYYTILMPKVLRFA